MARKKTVAVKSVGLGDIAETVIKTTGLDKFVNGKDCGCEERKRKLNELFAFRVKARCMEENEYNDWKAFREVRTLKLSIEQVDYIATLYASLFNLTPFKPCPSCSPKPLISMMDRIDKVWETYENK